METEIRGPWIIRTGRWLTKRRGILLAPFFGVVLISARWSVSPWLETAQDILGFLCLVAGTRLRWVAASYHDSSHRKEPITAGPYAWVRHPLYLANFLLGLGVVLISGWWPMVIAYMLLFIPIHLLIARSEEIHLTRLYGARYIAYLRAVPALLPWRRTRGPRYGSRSEFKLQKGQERLKAIGYLAGMVGILMVKKLRDILRLPALHPLSWLAYAACIAGTVSAVILRPKTRSSFVRVFQTAGVVCGVLVLAIHLPGIWVTRTVVPDSHLSFQKSPVPTPAGQNRPWVPVPTRVESAPQGGSFLDYLAVLGGASAFGIATLVESKREGKDFQLNHELNEAGQVSLLVASILSLWSQWAARGIHPSGMSSSRENSWQFQVKPIFDSDGPALLAAWRRRF